MSGLHSALKTTIIKEVTVPGLEFKHVRLQNGKDRFVDTLHVRPNSWSSAGLQSTDFFSLIGFRRSQCAFFRGECFVREITETFDVAGFADSSVAALRHLQEGADRLEKCGLLVPRPEGWGYFQGAAGSDRRPSRERVSGNGHVAPKVERLKESEDAHFRFVLSWLEGAGAQGWTTHFRAKHMPLTPEFNAALSLLGGFSTFDECPEFDFEMCWWRFTSFQPDGSGFRGKNTEYVHRCFDGLGSQFSPGLESLLAAHAELQKYGISFLTIDPAAPSVPPARQATPLGTATVGTTSRESVDLDTFDVAISFAGTEREHARQLAVALRAAGFKVFYDDFYPEQLWGKDLAAFFDRVYRKASRYCVMLVSAEYEKRIWTSHERRSAQARALQEKGQEYILPIRFDETDLDGLPPTVGYLPFGQYSIDQIAELLIKKLKG